ncbi:CBS domain-containing protein [Haloplanus salilacus]|uniref:CBS domain-containing protein n=1 Tax=Haloplanus salilacus TaxID=2949994 RepID=UPI0030D10399
MLVEELMQTDIVTSDIEGTVRAAVEQMLRNHVGSVVVVDDGNPTGIVTETDILKIGYGTERCFGDIPLERAMSRPLVTIAPDKSIRAAMRTMRTENVKKLPVQDGIDLVGILTMVDVTRAYNDIVKEIHAMEQPVGFSEAELRGLGTRRE